MPTTTYRVGHSGVLDLVLEEERELSCVEKECPDDVQVGSVDNRP